MKRDHNWFDRDLVEDMIELANKARKKDKARALWRLAMVEKLVLERLGLWK